MSGLHGREPARCTTHPGCGRLNIAPTFSAVGSRVR